MKEQPAQTDGPQVFLERAVSSSKEKEREPDSWDLAFSVIEHRFMEIEAVTERDLAIRINATEDESTSTIARR